MSFSSPDIRKQAIRDHLAYFIVYLYYIYKMECNVPGRSHTTVAPGLCAPPNAIATFTVFFRHIAPRSRGSVFNLSEECIRAGRLDTVSPNVGWFWENVRGVVWDASLDTKRVHKGFKSWIQRPITDDGFYEALYKLARDSFQGLRMTVAKDHADNKCALNALSFSSSALVNAGDDHYLYSRCNKLLKGYVWYGPLAFS